MTIKSKTLIKLIILFIGILFIATGVIYQLFFIKPPLYTIDFDSDGGTKIENIKIYENEVPIMPKDPIKSGYYFVGWFLNGQQYHFNTPVTEDVYLIAQWEELKIIK